VNIGITRTCRALVLAAAAASLALGLWLGVPRRRDRPREPAWSVHLAPLVTAPLADGRPSALVIPPTVSPLAARNLLFETVWLRPGVRWLPRTRLPGPAGPSTAVLITPRGAPASIPPPGWREAWRRGWITVLERSRR